jgi:hypothetical protein
MNELAVSLNAGVIVMRKAEETRVIRDLFEALGKCIPPPYSQLYKRITA